VQSFFKKYASIAEIVEVTQPMLSLQSHYIQAGIVNKKSLQDALHVAVATIAKSDLIVSWNFKHIVHFDKIPKYNAINLLNGYNNIGIYSPLEVIEYEKT
jgi:hypothetical protein